LNATVAVLPNMAMQAMHSFGVHGAFRKSALRYYRILIQAGDSLLDVGCGFADLYSYLSSTQRSVSYTAQDILNKAMQMHPSLAL